MNLHLKTYTPNLSAASMHQGYVTGTCVAPEPCL